MTNFNIFDHYEQMRKSGIVLAFQGAISQNMLVGLGELLKDKVTLESSNAKVVRKIFSIFIELAQNIARYSAEKLNLGEEEGSVGTGIIMVSHPDKVYTISSGNLISNSKIDDIRKRCEIINNMDADQRKKYYKEQIKLPRREGTQGAGIGLIDMARKSGNTIEMQVSKVNKDVSFMVLSIGIEEE